MQELKRLWFDVESEIRQLAETHRRLKEDYKALKEKNKGLKERIVKLEEKVKSQSEEVVRYKLSGKVYATDNYTDVKLKLNELVREIDKCIGLLND
jgi:chromosome segregation ATPase